MKLVPLVLLLATCIATIAPTTANQIPSYETWLLSGSSSNCQSVLCSYTEAKNIPIDCSLHPDHPKSLCRMDSRATYDGLVEGKLKIGQCFGHVEWYYCSDQVPTNGAHDQSTTTPLPSYWPTTNKPHQEHEIKNEIIEDDGIWIQGIWYPFPTGLHFNHEEVADKGSAERNQYSQFKIIKREGQDSKEQLYDGKAAANKEKL